MNGAVAGVDNDIGGFVRLKCNPIESRLMGKGVFRFHAVVVQVYLIRVRRDMFVIVVVSYDGTKLFFPDRD